MDERNEDYDIYGSFACVYDKFMDNVPYKEWGKYLKSLLEEQGISDGLVLELGCGTGSLTEILADAGYDMIGVDLSADMLDIAMENGNSPAIIFSIFCRICGNLSCTGQFGQWSASAIP